MENTIILSFNFSSYKSFDELQKYCNRFKINTNTSVKKYINNLIRKNILIENNTVTKKYALTEEGIYIINQLNIYYCRIIIDLYRNYKNMINKKYTLKEIRPEQNNLRNYLISNTCNICTFCEKKLPYCLLETAHIKPRYLLDSSEKNDYNNVIFLCRICHVLFDKGYIGINNNHLFVSEKLNILEYDLPIYKIQKKIIKEQEGFFDYHYKYIYKK